MGRRFTAQTWAAYFPTEVREAVRHRKNPVGLQPAGTGGAGAANIPVRPEQLQTCQLQAGRLRTGCWPQKESGGREREGLMGLMVVRKGERWKEVLWELGAYSGQEGRGRRQATGRETL